MNTQQMILNNSLKKTGTAYLFWIILGAHYAYLNKWGLQILFWLTFGGFGIWALIDLFTIPSKVDAFNAPIYAQMEKLDEKI